MLVSWNRDAPKSSISRLRFSLINQPFFGYPSFMETIIFGNPTLYFGLLWIIKTIPSFMDYCERLWNGFFSVFNVSPWPMVPRCQVLASKPLSVTGAWAPLLLRFRTGPGGHRKSSTDGFWWLLMIDDYYHMLIRLSLGIGCQKSHDCRWWLVIFDDYWWLTDDWQMCIYALK